MCVKKFRASDFTKIVGRPTLGTPTFFLTLVALVEGSPEKSFMIRFPNKDYPADPKSGDFAERSPLEPIPCSADGCQEILQSMELGLSNTATVLWVNLPSDFVPGAAKADREAKEITGEMTKKLDKEGWTFTSMASVIIEAPHKATHWLVSQPLADAQGLCEEAIKRDSLGMWKTEQNLYFIVPAGYQNVLEDEGLTRAEFFAANAEPFRKACDQTLDMECRARRAREKAELMAEVARQEAERMRQEKMPELIKGAQDIVELYNQELSSIPERLYGDEKPVALRTEGEYLILGEQTIELSDEALAQAMTTLTELEERIAGIQAQVERAEGYRALLREVGSKNMTVKDRYGMLKITGTPTLFGKLVEVELADTEAIITVWKKGQVKQQERFSYNEKRADAFNLALAKLGLKEGDDYDDDPIAERRESKPTISWKERLMTAGAAVL